MHGVDFKKELAKRGVSFDSDSMNEIPEFSSLLLEKEDKSDDVSCFQRIDMSGIRDNGDMLCGLLSKNPPFYPFKDFHKLYQQNINTISRKIGRVLNGKCTLGEILKVSPKSIFRSDKIQFCIDSNFECGYSLTYNEKDDERDFCYFEELVAAVMNINPDYLSDYDNSVSAFYQLVSVALHLLCNSCVVPQIIMLQKNKYAVRWLPSVLNQEVRSVLNCLEKIVPSDLLLSKFSRKKSFFPVEKSGEHLLSCIITCIIPCLLEKYNDKVTAPFMMRRLKTDKSIISDLPDKIEQNEPAILSERQLPLYEQTLSEAMKEIEGVVETDNQSMFKRQGLVLQMILALKQICNHPALFLKNGDLTPEHSGKMLLVLDMLRSIVESEQKVLVFTQFKEMGDILQRVVADVIGEKPLFLHGGCSVKQRQNMVNRFQNERHERIFILSLKAAGTGLNLTAATHVIHYDLWWNPAVEAQATDRAYRIGQHQNVMVHRFITRNTFEERINAMIQDKKELAEMTVSSGENWIGKLSNKELRDIFTIKK